MVRRKLSFIVLAFAQAGVVAFAPTIKPALFRDFVDGDNVAGFNLRGVQDLAQFGEMTKDGGRGQRYHKIGNTGGGRTRVENLAGDINAIELFATPARKGFMWVGVFAEGDRRGLTRGALRAVSMWGEGRLYATDRPDILEFVPAQRADGTRRSGGLLRVLDDGKLWALLGDYVRTEDIARMVLAFVKGGELVAAVPWLALLRGLSNEPHDALPPALAAARDDLAKAVRARWQAASLREKMKLVNELSPLRSVLGDSLAALHRDQVDALLAAARAAEGAKADATAAGRYLLAHALSGLATSRRTLAEALVAPTDTDTPLRRAQWLIANRIAPGVPHVQAAPALAGAVEQLFGPGELFAGMTGVEAAGLVPGLPSKATIPSSRVVSVVPLEPLSGAMSSRQETTTESASYLIVNPAYREWSRKLDSARSDYYRWQNLFDWARDYRNSNLLRAERPAAAYGKATGGSVTVRTLEDVPAGLSKSDLKAEGIEFWSGKMVCNYRQAGSFGFVCSEKYRLHAKFRGLATAAENRMKALEKTKPPYKATAWAKYRADWQRWAGTLRRVVTLAWGKRQEKFVQEHKVDVKYLRASGPRAKNVPNVNNWKTDEEARRLQVADMDAALRKKIMEVVREARATWLAGAARELDRLPTGDVRESEGAWLRYFAGTASAADLGRIEATPKTGIAAPAAKKPGAQGLTVVVSRLGPPYARWVIPFNAFSNSFAISSNGRYLVARSLRDSVAVVHNLETGEYKQLVTKSKLPFDRRTLGVSDDGETIAPEDRAAAMKKFMPGSSVIAVSPDGRSAMGVAAGAIVTWDVATGKVLGRREGLLPAGFEKAVPLAISDDRRRAVVSGPSVVALALDAGAAFPLSGWARSINLSADGRKVLVEVDFGVWLYSLPADEAAFRELRLPIRSRLGERLGFQFKDFDFGPKPTFY